MRIHTSHAIIVCLSSRTCDNVYLILNLPAQMEAARTSSFPQEPADAFISSPAAESSTAQGIATTALPLQLSQMLGDAARKVADFTELLPGIPWTN